MIQTELQKGVKVKISREEFNRLKEKIGFLSREFYPEEYKTNMESNEEGRFLIFKLNVED